MILDRYLGHFEAAGQKAPITPNYNHSNEDKQWIMRHLSRKFTRNPPDACDL
jgi:hypothetical protein